MDRGATPAAENVTLSPVIELEMPAQSGIHAEYVTPLQSIAKKLTIPPNTASLMFTHGSSTTEGGGHNGTPREYGSTSDVVDDKYSVHPLWLYFYNGHIEEKFREHHTRGHSQSGSYYLFIAGSIFKPVYVIYLIIRRQKEECETKPDCVQPPSLDNPFDYSSFAWQCLLPCWLMTWMVAYMMIRHKKWLLIGSRWQVIITVYWLSYFALVEGSRHWQQSLQRHFTYSPMQVSLTQEVYYLNAGIITVWLMGVLGSAGLRFPFAITMSLAVIIWNLVIICNPQLHYGPGRKKPIHSH